MIKVWERFDRDKYIGRGRRYSAVVSPMGQGVWRYDIIDSLTNRVYLRLTARADENDLSLGVSSRRLAMALANRLLIRLGEED